MLRRDGLLSANDQFRDRLNAYFYFTTSKEQIQNLVDQLPAKVSPDELVERLILIQRFEQGRAELAEGTAISHEEAGQRLEKWLR